MPDRDVLSLKTPPPGVAAQLAAPSPIEFDEGTRPNATIPERLERREARATAAAASVTHLGHRAAELVTKGAIAETNARVAGIERDVVGIKVDVARHDGKLDTLVEYAGAAAAERERRSARDAYERAAKRRMVVPIIRAIGAAIAGAISAWAVMR